MKKYDNSGLKRYFFTVILMSVIVGTLSTSCQSEKPKKKDKPIINIPSASNEQLVDEYYNSVYENNSSENTYTSKTYIKM